MLLRLTTALIGGLTACAVMAADFQPVDTIKAAALGALPVGADAEATLDPALRLPRCGAALVARVQGSNSVEVACPDGWRLFVPVRVRRSQTVLVLSRGIAPGETITADAFVPETRDASRIVGAAVADPAQAVGRVARRTLSAGAVLSATDLVAQRLPHVLHWFERLLFCRPQKPLRPDGRHQCRHVGNRPRQPTLYRRSQI